MKINIFFPTVAPMLSSEKLVAALDRITKMAVAIRDAIVVQRAEISANKDTKH
jgi:hypothetical protein